LVVGGAAGWVEPDPGQAKPRLGLGRGMSGSHPPDETSQRRKMKSKIFDARDVSNHVIDLISSGDSEQMLEETGHTLGSVVVFGETSCVVNIDGKKFTITVAEI
jgi:hypothetical protein